MKNNQYFTLKLGRDMFVIQLIWAFWFLVIQGGIVLVTWLIFSRQIEGTYSVYLFTQIFSIVMMIFAMIMGGGYLKDMVRNGITRRDGFYAIAISAVMLSAVMTIISLIITATAYSLGLEMSMNVVNSFGAFMTYVTAQFIILLQFYVIGWLIVIGFSRYRFFGGIIAIFIGVLIVGLFSVLSPIDIDIDIFTTVIDGIPFINIPNNLEAINLTNWWFIAVSFLTSGAILFAIRLASKHMPVSIE